MSGADRVLTGLLILCTSVWVGGLVTIPVVGRLVRQHLAPADRVVLFRGLGRFHGVLGTGALVVGLGAGAALLAGRDWGGLRVAATVVGLALLVVTGIGMAQARRMTRLRRALLASGPDPVRQTHVQRGSRLAVGLRVGIGVLTVVLLVLGVLLIR